MISPQSPGTNSPALNEHDIVFCAKLDCRDERELGALCAASSSLAAAHIAGASCRRASACAFAAPLGHRFGEVSRTETVNHSHTEMLKIKNPSPVCSAIARENQKSGRQDAPNVDREHDGIAHHPARMELLEKHRIPRDGQSQDRTRGVAFCRRGQWLHLQHLADVPQPAPSAKAGTNGYARRPGERFPTNKDHEQTACAWAACLPPGGVYFFFLGARASPRWPRSG